MNVVRLKDLGGEIFVVEKVCVEHLVGVGKGADLRSSLTTVNHPSRGGIGPRKAACRSRLSLFGK